MGAPVVKSAKAYVYGIPANSVTIVGFAASIVIESAEIDTSAQVNDPAIGEDGRAEAHTVGGEAYTLNINAYLVGNVPPIGTKVTVTIKNQTTSGALTQIKPSVGNRAYGKVTITANGFEGIAY